MIKRFQILWFIILTGLLSLGVYYLPLPGEQKSLMVPVLLVFVPSIVSIPLALLTEGREGLRQLFWRVPHAWKWVLIGAGVGILMRFAVLITGLLLGTSIQVDLSAPGTAFILLAPIPLAWFEELGWRRYALHRLLKTQSPLNASLILGLPWGLIHLIIILPGMMSAGAPAIPQTIALIALSVVLTWAYVHSRGSLLTVTLLHGVQNGLVLLNRGLGIAEATWLMMWVYVAFALILVVLDRKTFFSRTNLP